MKSPDLSQDTAATTPGHTVCALASGHLRPLQPARLLVLKPTGSASCHLQQEENFPIHPLCGAFCLDGHTDR